MKQIADAKNEKETVNKIVVSATSQQLKTILRLLHFVCNGDIPLSGDIYLQLSKARKINNLRKRVEKKGALSKTLKEDPGSQKAFLIDYIKHLSSIIEPIFYKK